RREDRRRDRADHRHPARPAGHLRLRGEAGSDGRGPPGDGRGHDRHGRVDRHGPVGERAGGGGRRRQAPRGERRADEDARRPAAKRGFEAEVMSVSRLFILRPVATSLLMAAILLAGAIAYKQLPVSALPQVDYPTIQVVTFYPGASPDVMASSVTSPLERQF